MADTHATGSGPDHGPGTAVVLIAHGSRNPATAADHAALCARVGAAAGRPVRPAYLELSEPSIPDAIDAAVAGGATTVRLVPFFLHVGNHVLRDLPAIVGDARGRHPGVEIVLDEHVGADPRLVDLVADRIRAGTG
jgi:sirohydrochlorin ferrochelatase